MHIQYAAYVCKARGTQDVEFICLLILGLSSGENGNVGGAKGTGYR